MNESCLSYPSRFRHMWFISHMEIRDSHIYYVRVTDERHLCVNTDESHLFLTYWWFIRISYSSVPLITSDLFFVSYSHSYGVVLASRIDKIIGLFCKRVLQKTRYSAKETYNCIDPTDRSHPISLLIPYWWLPPITFWWLIRVVSSLLPYLGRWGAGVETHFQEI